MNLAEALAAHQMGRLSEAEEIYTEILKTNPADFASMHLLGVIALQTGRTEEGVELIRDALSINENVADAHSNLGNGLLALKLLDEALTSYDRAIALKPDHADAFNNRGVVLLELERLEEALASHDQAIALKPTYSEAYRNRGDTLRKLNRLPEALTSYDKAVVITPNRAEAHNKRGDVLMELKRFAEAIASYDMAIALDPQSAGTYNNRGIALAELKRSEEALASYDTAIALKPGLAESYNNRGNALRDLRRYDEALANYDMAVTIRPEYVEALFNRGNALSDLGRSEEALANYNAAVALRADHADAYNNRGIALSNLKRPREALGNYEKAIGLYPGHAEAHNNRGTIFLELNQHAEALANFDKAIELAPDYVDAQRNRGNALAKMQRFGESFAVYDKLFRLDPNQVGIEGHRLNAKMQLCDWRNIETEISHLIQSVRNGLATTQPFFFLAVPSTSKDQLQCSKSWVSTNFPPSGTQVWRGERYDHSRIRVAYISADFRHHPLSYLMAGLFECHDKSRFEIIAVSLAPEENSDIHQRLKCSFDRFIYAQSYTDDQLAELLRNLRVDILVDLMGFTTNARTAIFARRPAPIQVSYLGYPGTMGAPYIDYMIADRVVIPVHQREFYSEKVVFLPNTYWVNDSKRRISETRFSRDELGLPASGFVFCCFNNAYKITPLVFDCWMRILKRVPGSVLWLLENSAQATGNLRNEAIARGVDASRLIFAKRMAPAEHLARHLAADLCLDTLPYNAHTTASDALWAGTPILTCLGETFVGRVAASLLWAVQLPELVTTELRDYEEKAIELAMQPEKLARINLKLAKNNEVTALFNTERFTRHLERAFSKMIEGHRSGSAPADLYLSD